MNFCGPIFIVAPGLSYRQMPLVYHDSLSGHLFRAHQ